MKLEETLRTLSDGGVEFVVVGGAATQVQGSARLTEDLEFCYRRKRDNIERLAKALAPFYPRLRDAPDGLPFRFDAATIEHGSNFTLLTDLGAIDFLGHVAGLGDYQGVAKESESVNLFGLDQRVLSIGGLIKAKKAADRPKDREAIAGARSYARVPSENGHAIANSATTTAVQSSSGFSGTDCEARSNSPANAHSAGRRPSACSAEIRTTSGLLFSWEMCASTR